MNTENLTGWDRREFLQAAAAGVTAGLELFPRTSTALAADLPKPGTSDWPRFGYDLHNTRFNAREKRLGADNVGRLKLKWKTEIGAPIQTTPSPVFLYWHTFCDGTQTLLNHCASTVKQVT